ncbi:MAG: hypothetical protein E7615_05930 [Ruminococcaceae bacterium]|nr:hypothetical protein [Oscillospiraceae bacterium]
MMTGNISVADVPAYVTVHLGSLDEMSENVNVSFPEYIKTVVSLAVSPDIPKDALYAITYAYISRALYRITQKKYRKMGYSFDITNDPSDDIYYEYNSAIFGNVNETVDLIFNEYLANGDEYTPFDAVICYSKERCRGLSVEGAIELAKAGKNYTEILEYYFGGSIRIEKNAEVFGLENEFLIGYPMYEGQRGGNVSGLQIALNRISANYPTIPFIENANGFYNNNTSESVKEFQRIFDLPISGSIEKNTYYKLLYVIDSIRRLNQLVVYETQFEGITPQLRAILKYGDVGNQVKLLQYYLLFVSSFDDRVPPPQVVGVYGEKTYQSVTAFQNIFGFEPNGIVTQEVFGVLQGVYKDLFSVLPPSAFSEKAVPYGGSMLVLGSVGRDVRYLQQYLNKVADAYPIIQSVLVTGEFDRQTEDAVKNFQSLFEITPTGVVTSTTWNILAQVYNAILASE